MLKMAPLNSPSSKSPIWTRDRVSSPSRSHFSPGLKLILRTQVTNPEIATFQSLSKGVYGMCIYICLYVQNWLKKLEDPQSWFLVCGDIFGLARTSSSFGKILTHLTELWRNCHIFEGVKNHINADISHPIRDRNAKTFLIRYVSLW